MKPVAKLIDPATLGLKALSEIARQRLEAHDGRLAAIIARGSDDVTKAFPNTVKQAADPKNKVAQTEVEKMIMTRIQKRAVKFLRANP
jgi:hypothetical protein